MANASKKMGDTGFLIAKLSMITTREKAKVALAFLPYHRPSEIARIIGVSRQVIDWWKKQYPDLVPEGDYEK